MKKTFLILAMAGAMSMMVRMPADAQPNLQTSTDSVDYLFGLNMAYSLGNNPYIRNQDLVLKGFIHALEGNAAWDADASRALLMELLSENRGQTGAGSNTGSEENLAKGKAFLAENGKREGVMSTGSGLQYEIITAGSGARPTASSTVEVHYEGTLIDGSIFDSSYERGETISFPLNRVIKGWTEGVQLMQVGSVYRFYIPSELAYGPRGQGSIPSNSVLIFKIELLGIQ